MAGLPIYECAVLSEWIDYNGHLRDAYYGLIFSYAIDALMERIGIDAAYRERSACTLYTLEQHAHYLEAVGNNDRVAVTVRILDGDHKRLHAAFELHRAGAAAVAASAEFMLLHVCQSPGPASAPFPPQVLAAIAELQVASAGPAAAGPGSRRMQINRAARAS